MWLHSGLTSRLPYLSIVSTLLTAPLALQSQGSQAGRVMAGTYRVFFCRGTCDAKDTASVATKGFLVLSSSSMRLSSLSGRTRRKFQRLYHSVARSSSPNACFVFDKRSVGRELASAQPVGFTNWVATDTSAELTLYRAPDSGYNVYLHSSSDNSVTGEGALWSGNAGGDESPKEAVIAYRMGPATARRCIVAARSAPDN